MQFKITTDEVRLVAPTVHDRTATYTSIPEPEVRARRIATEARLYLGFAAERSRMTPETLRAKAFDSACFSVAVGASAFAVPSKLSGTKAHQSALWQIVRDGYRAWDRLELDTRAADGVGVSYGDERLGEVQPKHVPWLRPLVPFGLQVYVGRITGSETEGRTLGVNIVVAHIAQAIAAISEALGASADSTSGDGASGDGAQGAVLPSVFPRPALPRPRAGMSSGDGASGDGAPSLRLVTPAQPDPLDVVLFRAVDGTAHASVAGRPLHHVVRHSPSGIEWAYAGSGPADLALSVLALVAGVETAERHYQAFKVDIVAELSYAGGVLRAGRVRDWIARQNATA